MKCRYEMIGLAAAVILTVGFLQCGTLLAADTVRKVDGGSVAGDVTTVTAASVKVDRNGTITDVPANEVLYIKFDGEPPLMTSARIAMLDGQYEDAIASLDSVKPNNLLRPELKQDYEFLRAYCEAKMSLGGSGSVQQAATNLATFVNNYTNNYHYVEACEMVGDLLVAADKPDLAKAYYERMAKAPWPDAKMRANVALGLAQLATGQVADARKSFTAAIGTTADGPLAAKQKLAAQVGLARCDLTEGKGAAAITAVEEVIKQADPNLDSDLMAKAYNTLGLAYIEANKPKEALFAFLHTDLLYFMSPPDHVVALKQLNKLWVEVGHPERAAEAAEKLRDRYKQQP